MLEFAVIVAWAIWPSSFSKQANTHFESTVISNPSTAFAESSPPDHEPHVKELLQSLHDFHQKRKSLYVDFERTIVDSVWGEKITSTGSARVKGTQLARIDVVDPCAISCVLPGSGELWVYEPSSTQHEEATIRVFRLEAGNRLDCRLPSALGFIVADPLDWADDFHLEITHPSETEVTLRLTPANDNAWVKRVELTWNSTNGLPTMIVIEEHTTEVYTYRVTKAHDNIEIKTEDFTKFIVPNGWKVIQAGSWPFKLFGR